MREDLEELRSLAVWLHGRRVGVITRLAGDRQLFAFDEDYAEDPSRPTLSLSYKVAGGGLTMKPRSYAARVPPFFANVLPEGRLRDYLASQAGVKPEREFFLLAVLGRDLPGAVEVVPLGADEDAAYPSPAEGECVADGMDDGVLRFSLAGVQLKFSAVMGATGGVTIPGNGLGGSWIIKLPSPEYESVPENEFVMLDLARAVGIVVPETRLVPVEAIEGLPREAARLTGQALAVKRFDRGPAGERIHIEDFAQVFGMFPEDKYRKRSYANIAEVLWAETGAEGTREFMRRLVFSVVIGNGDMHLKNWSLIYPDGRTPELSPAYDLVSTVPYIEGEKLALTMGGSRSLGRITKEQIRQLSDRAGLPVGPTWEITRETIERVRDAWANLEARKHLKAALDNEIDSQIRAVSTTSES